MTRLDRNDLPGQLQRREPEWPVPAEELRRAVVCRHAEILKGPRGLQDAVFVVEVDRVEVHLQRADRVLAQDRLEVITMSDLVRADVLERLHGVTVKTGRQAGVHRHVEGRLQLLEGIGEVRDRAITIREVDRDVRVLRSDIATHGFVIFVVTATDDHQARDRSGRARQEGPAAQAGAGDDERTLRGGAGHGFSWVGHGRLLRDRRWNRAVWSSARNVSRARRALGRLSSACTDRAATR